MKRLFALLLGAVMLLSLIGCGDSSADASPEEESENYDASEFIGMWQYDEYLYGFIIYEDGSFEYYGSDGMIDAGQWELGGDCMTLPGGSTSIELSFTGDGGLMDQDGDTLYSCDVFSWDMEDQPSVELSADYIDSWYDSGNLNGTNVDIYDDYTYGIWADYSDASVSSGIVEVYENYLDLVDDEGNLAAEVWLEDAGTLTVNIYNEDLVNNGVSQTMIMYRSSESVVPEEPAYFDIYGLSVNYTPDDGAAIVPASILSFNDDGANAERCQGTWQIFEDYRTDLGDGTIEVAFYANCHGSVSDYPACATSGAAYHQETVICLVDYNLGYDFTIGNSVDEINEDNWTWFTYEWNGEEITIAAQYAFGYNYESDNSVNFSYYFVVRMPADYDGLLLCAPGAHMDYEDMLTNSDIPAGSLIPIDERFDSYIYEDALFWRING